MVMTPSTDRDDRGAHDARFEAMYADLHRLARRESRRLGGLAEWGTTTLLHEAYLTVVDREHLAFPDRERFLGYVARMMRGLVIDHVRARGALRRGGDFTIVPLDTLTAEGLHDPATIASIGDALAELEQLEPELARLVDLRFFCGFTMAEIASQQQVTERTVQRQWQKARALLYRALERG